MKKVVFYFHGYASSPKTDKVDKLRDAGFVVYAFPIDIDPKSSIPSLYHNIDFALCNHIDEDIDVVFVGTSLGGYYAAKLAKIYDTKSVIVNPSIEPSVSLAKYGVDPEIMARYDKMNFSDRAKYFIAEEDEVLDFSMYKDEFAKVNCTYVPNCGHRFNGPEFDLVIDAVKNI